MLREAFTRLPPCCQQLISQLIEGPPVRYAKIGIAVRSIGSRRSRCLDELHRNPAIAALLDADAASQRRAVRAASGEAMTISQWLRLPMPCYACSPGLTKRRIPGGNGDRTGHSVPLSRREHTTDMRRVIGDKELGNRAI